MLMLFCADGNIYSVLARGAGNPKYKLKFAAQLFSCGDYHLCPSKAGYYILGGAAFSDVSFLSVCSDPLCYTAACLVCEAVQKCVQSENKRMYAETVAALGELSAVDGIRPDLICLRILLAALITGGLAGEFGTSEKSRACVKIIEAPPGDVSAVPVAADTAIALLQRAGKRFALQFGPLNSLPVLLQHFCA